MSISEDKDTFLRGQSEAITYIENVPELKERLLLEAAYSQALRFFLRSESYKATYEHSPFDLHWFVQALHGLFRRPDLLQELISGKHSTLEEALNELEIF